MQLAHIAIDRLNISAVNMRHARRAPDVSDILPSVRARGVLVPLLVRPNSAPDMFEIVAGRRRYFAAKSIADERGEADPLPCAIMEDGDDADALEASLIENIARLDPDEVSQWETAYLEAGWAEVVVLEPGQYFPAWDHEKTPKKKGGKIVITISHRGEVECHEGWLSHKEARRARGKADAGEEADTPAKPSRPELSGPMQNYVDLHRHAAVRAAMLDHAGTACA
ncbi:ParB/RepB/Spo0J family partition protein [Mesorhizobium waimense]|uniref:ParB/RepB/Spo0J family partition protein n=1 Tax=Mesorhizobium waimense TaxID=1300307 RepID=UPI001FDFD910|nr:ParB N-terminal domain-containing protein [Mesorhizobium waimense]